MADRPVVLLSQRLGTIGEEERRIEASGAELRSAALWTPAEIAQNAADATIVILGAVEPFDAAALESLPNLQAVVRRGVGYDNVDVTAATRLGIVVAYVPDASVEEVSDHALALLLALERRIVTIDGAVHAGMWQRDPSAIAELRAGIRRLGELSLGIVGFGRIGQAVARKAHNIYGAVLAADPIVSEATAAAHGARLVPLEELLQSADHISLHAPLLPSTRHVINDASLATMRAGVVVVNTARGGLVDQEAVVRAVSAAGSTIGAVGLDVTEPEPLPPDHPLLTAPRVFVTAHSAASSTTAARELARRSVDAVVALLAGRRPDELVNPEVLGLGSLRAGVLASTQAGAD